MRAAVEWITSFLDGPKPSAARIAALLTDSGTEIEACEKTADGWIVEAAITSNRPDEFCHLGLARDVAAVLGRTLILPPHTAEATGVAVEQALKVVVEDATRAPRYTARVIRGISNGVSPEWMQQRLLAAGQRPINAVVDISNYVMLECGQPLHAFDLDRLNAASLNVRMARPGEKLAALNGRTLTLAAEDLVIADGLQPQALAGVMGGSNSEVTLATRNIVIESAVFAPRGVRASARRHQLRTESGHRFERGVDRNACSAAGERAARLVLEICGGTLAAGVFDLGGAGPAPAPISFNPARVRKVMGANVPQRKMSTWFRALGCSVDESAAQWLVTAPGWRHDLHHEIDLVEEVVRIAGLERVPERISMPLMVATEPAVRLLRAEVQDLLVGLGCHECVTPDFVREGAEASAALHMQAIPLAAALPVRSGEGVLRRSLLPSLLRVARHNQDQGNGTPALFEVSPVNGLGPTGTPARRQLLGVLLACDWREARAVLDAVLSLRGVQATPNAMSEANAALDPTARACFKSAERTLAFLGMPAAELCGDLRHKALYLEVDLEALDGVGTAARRFMGLPRFPAVVRDLALKVRDAVSYSAVEEAVQAAEAQDIESLELFELYRGASIGAGMKSLNIRITFRSSQGTLTTAEVDQRVQLMIARIAAATGAEVRGA
ncbi:MAG: phenylalanine--tRNA ligase subunit beta [Planctomycetes bacterium]|nr:phenylalanine--tRNA ligase subunit beta [Planctomycetota bacterium]